MSGLWRKNQETREGKYPVVLRRDGTVPEWDWFVLGQRDPYAPTALRAYAAAAEADGADPQYVQDLRDMAADWDRVRVETGSVGDPDASRHRVDDPNALTFPASLRQFVERIMTPRGRSA